MTVLADGAVTRAGLGAPAGATAAALLTDRLAKVTAAAERLGRPDDPEGLHDFRVALRRLRSLIRAYREPLGDALPRRLRRRLRRLARATNLSRDLEVKLAWLDGQAEGLKPRERTGIRWLASRMRAEQAGADRDAFRMVAQDLPTLARTVAHRLEPLTLAPDAGGARFAGLSAGLLRELAHELEEHLARVRSIDDQEEAHDARIAGKRIRYLLEPLTAVMPLAGELVERLKVLQDLLGEMHDADVAAHLIAEAMEEAAVERGQRVADQVRAATALDATALRRERRRDPMPGLLTLATRVQDRRESSWQELERDWLPHAGPRLLTPLRELALALDRAAPAAMEIERKYLLSGVPERAREETPLEIEQGWLPGEQIQERLRRVVTRGGTRWLRTVKLGEGVARAEYEDAISEAMFETLWPLTEGRRLRKLRYRVAEGPLVWEIDQFLDRDLALAEVELPSADLVPDPPAWLAPVLVREVTGEPAWLNINLAS